MKKVLVVLLAVFMMGSLFACDLAPDRTPEPDVWTPEPDVFTTYYETPKIRSLDEYSKYISSRKLPPDFLRYEKIKQFGEFSFFELNEDKSDKYLKNHSVLTYWYDLNVSDHKVRLKVTQFLSARGRVLSPWGFIYAVDDTSDMRLISTEGDVSYFHDGIEYKYSSGKLVQITWAEQDQKDRWRNVYVLSGDLGDLPSDLGSSLVGELMNANNARATLKEIFPNLGFLEEVAMP
ncbi:MAG: hypothetical protein IIW31_09735 [Clostridia bacterium]|nr:hypothetical protein [Clostridia bacterium]